MSAIGWLVASCGRGDSGAEDDASTAEETSDEVGDGDGDGDGDGETDTGTPKLDVGPGDGDGDGDGDLCKVPDDDMDAPPPCEESAPPDSFDPAVQWDYDGIDGDDQVIATPVVVNLTDDNDDGAIDLCDVPDIVVPMYPGPANVYPEGHLHVLDGDTGALHFRIDHAVGGHVAPAVGDIDGDGISEIVTLELDGDQFDSPGRLVAFEHDGTLAWEGEKTLTGPVAADAVGLADLDADGSVEIYVAGHVADSEGNELFTATMGVHRLATTTAADLDDDGDMELIVGKAAYHHDGSVYFDASDGSYKQNFGAPHVADIDDDGLPEVLVQETNTVTIFQHDGTPGPTASGRTPMAVHDVDGDGLPELLVALANEYRVLEHDLALKWSSPIIDSSGMAAGSAFDFIGSGQAQAVYADEVDFHIYDADGNSLLSVPRSSGTQTEFPVVADVDNDGSAEVVVGSNSYLNMEKTAPAVQVIRDAEDRWIPARRVWNQHTYHVTNVREDGTLPQSEPQHWKLLNTFRTQAQVEAGGVCDPPEG